MSIMPLILSWLLFWWPQYTIPQHTGATASSAGGVTWTLVQHPHNWTCTSTSSGNLACTVTVSATTAGDGLLLALSYYVGVTSVATAPAFVSASGDSTWTHNSSCTSETPNGSNFEGTDCVYISSATGGATSLSMTYGFSNVLSTDGAYMDLELYEVRRSTGSSSLDALNTSHSNSCTTCTGPALTLGGSSDYVAEWGAFCNSPTVSGAPYTNPSDVDAANNQIAAFLGALNQSSAGALTYTQSPSCGASMGAFAWK